MTTFRDALVREGSKNTYTENGAITHSSSLDGRVDLFAQGGAYRNRNDFDVIRLFTNAFAVDKNDALRILMYLRDIRNGAGERRFFRIVLNWLAENNKFDGVAAHKLFEWVVMYGRYDDLYAFIGTPLERDMFAYMQSTLKNDMNTNTPTLLAKWLKSINSKNRVSKYLARKFRDYLDISSEEYRKILSQLRTNLKIVEKYMSNNNWAAIKYEHVPSKAMMQYRNAFTRQDTQRFGQYLDDIKSGEKKINASCVYPYELIEKIQVAKNSTNITVLEEQWKALPNYVQDNKNSIVVADVSGSMHGRPLNVSISLALYMAERNTGVWKDLFMTFSESPQFVKIQGLTLRDKFNNISRANWEMNTNLQAVFDMVLSTAITYNVPQSEMLSTIYIVSDMEFDSACRDNRQTNLEIIREKYRMAGYEMPNLVFWNVNARNDNTPATFNEQSIALVSGYGPAPFKFAVENKTPIEVVREVIDSDRYKEVGLW